MKFISTHVVHHVSARELDFFKAGRQELIKQNVNLMLYKLLEKFSDMDTPDEMVLHLEISSREDFYKHQKDSW